MSIFEEFNKKFNVAQLAQDVKDIESQSGDRGDYEEVPTGTYEVKIEKLELGITKTSGKPMVKVWFKILEGSHKGSLIFMNQVVEQAFQVHIVKEFLKSLDTGLAIEFVDYNQFGNLLLDMHEVINAEKLEYGLEYGINDKEFNTFKITQVFAPNN